MSILQGFVEWEEKLAVRRSAVLFITLWMTWRAFTWAGDYARLVSISSNGEASFLAAAAMIAAVTAPITYLQAAVFRSYIEAKNLPAQ